MKAAKVAGAHTFIEKLDDGYDSQVGEGGVLLSVGPDAAVEPWRGPSSPTQKFL